MTSSSDPLLGALAGLRSPMPADQRDRILRYLELDDHYAEVGTPLGPAYVAFNRHGVSYLRLATGADEFVAAYRDRLPTRPLTAVERPPTGLAQALATGRGGSLEVDLRAATPFQREVLAAARTIRPGEVRTYGWVATRIGRPRAVRAVGTALATNPIPLVIPCHRVIRSDGSVGDYAFGAQSKRRLLQHEGADLDGVGDLLRRGYRYVGSATTGVFCEPSCHNARRITPGHRRLLTDAVEAQAQGFRACRSCHPLGTG